MPIFDRLNVRLAAPSRALLLVAALALVPTYLTPLWNLTMFAPQYQDGLRLDIYSYKLDGGNNGQDVKEINVLNHYIGMRDIEVADFTEFKWIPFVVGIMGLLFLRARSARRSHALTLGDGEDERRHSRGRRPRADRAHDRLRLAHHHQAGRVARAVDQRLRRRMEVRLPRLLPRAASDQLRPADAGQSPVEPDRGQATAGRGRPLPCRRRPAGARDAVAQPDARARLQLPGLELHQHG